MAEYLGLDHLSYFEIDRVRWFVVPDARRARGRRHRRRQVPRRAHHAGGQRPAAIAGACAAGAATWAPRAGFECLWGIDRSRRASTRWSPSGTCTSSAPRASSWPGQGRGVAPRGSTTRTRSCRTRSPSTTCVGSRMVSDPLHLLDCCVVTDGGGASSWSSPEIARRLDRQHRRGARPRRGAEAHAQRAHRPHLHRCRLVRAARLRRGRRAPSTTSTTRRSTTASPSPSLVTLEDLGFCEKGKGGALRGRRCARVAARSAAVQHRRRWAVQQPPRQPGRHDEDHRGRAPAARRGPSRRAGAELRAGARPRHRRLARHALGRGHPHPRDEPLVSERDGLPTPEPRDPRDQAVLGRRSTTSGLVSAALRRLRSRHLVPAAVLSASATPPTCRGSRRAATGHDLQLHGGAPVVRRVEGRRART